MTDRPNEISDVMEVAAKNPDLYSLLASDINLETLGLDQDRTSACEAARDHLRTQRIELLRACHSALNCKLGARTRTKKFKSPSSVYFFSEWRAKISIDFWVYYNDDLRVLYPDNVPLLVTFCTDAKGHRLDDTAESVHRYRKTIEPPQRVHLFRPRVVWKALEITRGPMEKLAAAAVDELDRLFDSETGPHSTTRARG